ncbi:Major facilitator family protein [Desulforapulum autotrophicum HRM2]|uniref:Major facilitator family protein n=1 Tax=Desulforapulum autotrophicum (strain ATCC 43914 / DSM 3382 / VKM B-1955 / HRM2) TaxID=177437 RepID=C0QAB6_DESAH|nr:MFS transporter [Desulforapulum autotrophicum]ACN14701.1 Major facilitator family protein [Desulforapulum autotrophicum HRM2]
MKTDNLKGQISLAAAMTIGAYGSFAAPLLISMYVDNLGMTLTQAGNAGAIELVAIALMQIAMGGLVTRIKSLRTFAMIMALIGMVFQVITPFATNYYMLLAVRLVIGITFGSVFGSALASSVVFKDPDRVVAKGSAGYCAIFAVVLFFLPKIFETTNAMGGCAYLSITCIPLLFMMLWLPTPQKGNTEEKVKLDLGPVRNIFIILIAGTLLVSLILQLPWIFSDVIGERLELTATQMGTAYSLSSIAMILGGLFSNFLGSTRISKISIMTFSAIASGVVCLGMATAPNYLIFLSTMSLAMVFYYISYPFAVGYAARLDDTGSLATITGGMFDLCAALTPILGSFLLTNYGTNVMGWVCFIIGVCAGGIYLLLGMVAGKSAIPALSNH